MGKTNSVCIAQAYDEYYGDGFYDDRYPKGNLNVTDRVLVHAASLLEQPQRVLDYGCGSGRYLWEVLAHTAADVYGFDVSEVAIQQAQKRLHGFNRRVSLFRSRSSLEKVLQQSHKVDVALLLFGVLAHIEGQENRREVLTWLFQHLEPGGYLLISVPNRYRRFPWLQLKNWNTPREGIRYERHQGKKVISLYYHLFSSRELQHELEDVGFTIKRIKAESILPERWVSHHLMLAHLDKVLCKLLPAWLGYGILAEARRPL